MYNNLLQPITTIACDVDEVLADFVRGTLAAHKRLERLDSWPRGEWDLPTVLSMPAAAVFEPLDNYEFWNGLGVIPGARTFVRNLERLAPVVYVTHPLRSHHAVRGKLDWMARELGIEERIFIGRPKHAIAHPGMLLVDDCDANIDAWQDAGAPALMFPAPWNRDWQIWELLGKDPLRRYDYVLGEVHRLILWSHGKRLDDDFIEAREEG